MQEKRSPKSLKRIQNQIQDAIFLIFSVTWTFSKIQNKNCALHTWRQFFFYCDHNMPIAQCPMPSYTNCKSSSCISAKILPMRIFQFGGNSIRKNCHKMCWAVVVYLPGNDTGILGKMRVISAEKGPSQGPPGTPKKEEIYTHFLITRLHLQLVLHIAQLSQMKK